MGKPRGCAMYAASFDATPPPPNIAVLPSSNIFRSINCSLTNWQDTGTIFTVGWNFITNELTLTLLNPYSWFCIERRTHLYWQECLMPGCDSGVWHHYDKDNWSITPAPPGVQSYTIVINLTDILAALPPPCTLSLLFVCGPHPATQGIPPKVIGVTPV